MTVPIRRFEPGASTDNLCSFMEKCGYQVSSHKGMFHIRKPGQPGRGKRLGRNEMMRLYDAERMKRGLEPVVKRSP